MWVRINVGTVADDVVRFHHRDTAENHSGADAGAGSHDRAGADHYTSAEIKLSKHQVIRWCIEAAAAQRLWRGVAT